MDAAQKVANVFNLNKLQHTETGQMCFCVNYNCGVSQATNALLGHFSYNTV